MSTSGHQRALQLVREIATIHLEGNITPHTWYKHIRHEDGKPDLPAITILSEIVYWYRPSVEKDERGNIIRYMKRFHEDKLRKSYKDLGETFGLTKRQARSAVEHLEKIGVITTELRTTVVDGVRCNNVLYIELVPEKLRQLCMPPNIEIKVLTPPTSDVTAPMTYMSQPHTPYVTGYDTVCQTNTETTTETTQLSIIADDAPASQPALGKSQRTRKQPDSQHHELLRQYAAACGYPINPAKEGKAASQLLKAGYTIEQIIACYTALKQQDYWKDKPLGLASVFNQIGAWLQAQGVKTTAPVEIKQITISEPQLRWIVLEERKLDLGDPRSRELEAIRSHRYMTSEQYQKLCQQGMPQVQGGV